MIARLFDQMSADARAREDLEWKYNDARAWAALWKRTAKTMFVRRKRLITNLSLVAARNQIDCAHWRGECRRLADKIRFIGIGDDSVFAELRELIPEAERILKELEETK